MKKILSILLCCVSILVFTTSCDKDEEETTFEEALLIGEWKNGTEHEKYNSDKTGENWNTADDVNEGEGQKFTWTLEKDQLEQLWIIEEGGGKVPKKYTVTTLNETNLTYKDPISTKTKSFTKVK